MSPIIGFLNKINVQRFIGQSLIDALYGIAIYSEMFDVDEPQIRIKIIHHVASGLHLIENDRTDIIMQLSESIYDTFDPIDILASYEIKTLYDSTKEVELPVFDNIPLFIHNHLFPEIKFDFSQLKVQDKLLVRFIQKEDTDAYVGLEPYTNLEEFKGKIESIQGNSIVLTPQYSYDSSDNTKIILFISDDHIESLIIDGNVHMQRIHKSSCPVRICKLNIYGNKKIMYDRRIQHQWNMSPDGTIAKEAEKSFYSVND